MRQTIKVHTLQEHLDGLTQLLNGKEDIPVPKDTPFQSAFHYSRTPRNVKVCLTISVEDIGDQSVVLVERDWLNEITKQT